MALLGGTLFALDGCKLSSNASKQWSGSVNDLKRKWMPISRTGDSGQGTLGSLSRNVMGTRRGPIMHWRTSELLLP
ncbi:MAG: hypothetical protein ABSA71_08360 [Desulfomonilia bacterium]